MQDNFNLKGYLRNNKLLNEGIGGYFDLKPINQINEGMQWDEDNVGTLADKALDRMGKSNLKAKVGDWISSKLGGPENDERFVAYLNDNNGEGEEALGDAIISYYEKDQDEEMNELNDLGNMEEADDSFIQAQRDAAGKKSSMTSDKGWQYDDDYTSSSNEFDFEDFDNTDLNGPSAEMVIDDLIGEFEEIISAQVPKNLQNSARIAVKELWKDKLASWGI